MMKRYAEPVQVQCKEGVPACFSWRGRSYGVLVIVRRWRQTGELWDPDQAVDREFFRVEAQSSFCAAGIYDLCEERRLGKWLLARVWD